MDNKTNDKLNSYKDMFGFENFDVRMENGSMVISPSDAGISLFAHIELSESTIARMEEAIDLYKDTLENVKDENAKLRNLLESALNFIEEEKESDKLIADILNTIYPITAIWDNGEEIRFNSDGTQVNK